MRLPGVGKQRFVFARKLLPQSTENHRDGVGIGKFGLQQFQQAQEVPGDGRAYDPRSTARPRTRTSSGISRRSIP